jgi:hypothetical protein
MGQGSVPRLPNVPIWSVANIVQIIFVIGFLVVRLWQVAPPEQQL